jgi:hypothetical protein
MRNKKNKGVSSTKKVRNTIGNKGIFSNRSTGNNKGHSKLKTLKEGYNAVGKLSSEAEARFRRIKEVMAEKSKYIKPDEFAGAGKIIDILDVDPDAISKYGPVVQFAVKEPKTNRDRIWPCTSIRALTAINPLLEKGKRLIHVWTTGTGTDKMYYAEAVSGGRQQEKSGKVKRKGTARTRRR